MVTDEQDRLSPDTIRRAVEIADGWGYNNLQKEPYIWTPTQGQYFADALPVEILDALAAQLVRQVDALPDVAFSCHGLMAVIMDNFRERARFEGPDRTANTTNAIVQFDKDNPGILS